MRKVFIVFAIKIIEGTKGYAENYSNLGTDSKEFISSLISEVDFSDLIFILI